MFAILKASPALDLDQNNPIKLENCLTILNYFMQDLELSMLYTNGEPLYYNRELPLLKKDIENEAPLLFSLIENSKANWSKLFISYYKSLMFYKIKNLHVLKSSSLGFSLTTPAFMPQAPTLSVNSFLHSYTGSMFVLTIDDINNLNSCYFIKI